MARFRETLWFKKGLIDAEMPELADQLPIEDRYLDDGSVTPVDVAQLSLHALSPSTRRTTR